MAKTIKTKVKNTAAAGAQGVQSVAAEALAAAAATAAGVVLGRVAEALGSGSQKVEQSRPEAETSARSFVVAQVGRRKKTARKTRGRKKSKAAKKQTRSKSARTAAKKRPRKVTKKRVKKGARARR